MITPDKKIDSSSAEVVRSFIATWNTHDTSATMDLLDPDIVFRSPLFSSPVRGIEARRGEIENFLTSMPDFEFKGLPQKATLSQQNWLGVEPQLARRSYPGAIPSHQPVDMLSSGWRGSFA